MTTNGQPLSGKTILVTGAAKRLGRAIALAAAESGADVAITYRESAREARAVVEELAQHDVDALAVRCDVTDEQSVRAMVKEVARELGGIDVLVNNAANYETAKFDKLTVAQWDAIFASNTRGPFLVSREALPYLRKRRGRIVNMGSLGGLRPWATHAHYCSSKAAVHMPTRDGHVASLQPQAAIHRQHLSGNEVRSGGKEHYCGGDVGRASVAPHGRLFRRLSHECGRGFLSQLNHPGSDRIHRNLRRQRLRHHFGQHVYRGLRGAIVRVRGPRP